MVDLVVPVRAPGAEQAAAAIGNTAKAADKLTVAEDRLTIAQRKAAMAAKQQEEADKRATEAAKKRVETVRRMGGSVGGPAGSAFGRIGGAMQLGGGIGLAAGGIGVGLMAASFALNKLEAAAARTVEAMERMRSVTKAGTDAAASVRAARASRAVASAESSRTGVARLLAGGMSYEQVKQLGPEEIQALSPFGRKAGAQLERAREASGRIRGELTPLDFLKAAPEGGFKSAEAALMSVLGVKRSDLSAALEQTKPAALFLRGTAGEAQRSSAMAARDMFDFSTLTEGFANIRIANDEVAASAKAMSEAQREITETLRIRAEAESAVVQVWKDSWLSNDQSAATKLREANQQFGGLR